MPRLTSTLSLVSLDLKAATAALDRELGQLLTEGVAEWVQTALDAIPVWSGASRSVFKGLADAVGVSVNARPVRGTNGRRAPDRRRLGQSISDFSIDLDGPVYSFSHSYPRDFYLFYNERADMRPFGFRLISPGPYDYRKKAKRAFDSVIRPGLRRLKFQVAAYVRSERIT